MRLAVERASEEERASPAFRAGVAASFQNAVLRHLEMRLTRAVRLLAGHVHDPRP